MKKLFLLMPVLIVLFTFCLFTVSADTGPKPSLTINVHGMGDEEYWLDLLVTGNPRFMWLEISDEEHKKVEKLAEYNQDGLHAALLRGTELPMYGSLIGERQKDGSYTHKFTYVGVPTEFKIAILKSDGTLIVSDKIVRTKFQSVMKYTVGSMGVNEKADSSGLIQEIVSWRNYALGFFLRLILTLAIEIGIALLFGFTLKRSWKVLLLTNIATQTLLNKVILGMTYQIGLFAVFFDYAIIEVLIMASESIVYSLLLKEKKIVVRILYGITANLISFIAGYMILPLP